MVLSRFDCRCVKLSHLHNTRSDLSLIVLVACAFAVEHIAVSSRTDKILVCSRPGMFSGNGFLVLGSKGL